MVIDVQKSDMLMPALAARILSVHPSTLKRWSDAGLIRVYRITPRGDRRYKAQDVLDAVKQIRNNTLWYQEKPLQSSNEL
jgi:DNA-binding transcriptional MerR regulator